MAKEELLTSVTQAGEGTASWKWKLHVMSPSSTNKLQKINLN